MEMATSRNDSPEQSFVPPTDHPSYRPRFDRIRVGDMYQLDHMVEVYRQDGFYLGTFPKSLIEILFTKIYEEKWEQLEFDFGPEFTPPPEFTPLSS